MTLNLADWQQKKWLHWNLYEKKRHNENLMKDNNVRF